MDEEIRGGRERALARGASAYFRAPANADNGSPAGRARSLARGASAYFKFTAAMEGEDEGSSAVRERALARGASATYIPPSEGRPRAENGHALVDTLDEAPPTPWTALWVASCVLTSLFGFLLGSLAYAHATAHTKPDSSQLFRLQQEVAGALVIMAHFREAAVIGCAACGVGCLTAWSAKPHLLWTSLVSLLGGTAYFAVMAVSPASALDGCAPCRPTPPPKRERASAQDTPAAGSLRTRSACHACFALIRASPACAHPDDWRRRRHT